MALPKWVAVGAATFLFGFMAACSELNLPELPSFSFGGSGQPSFAMLDNAVVAVGPQDFCVDANSSDGSNGFAAIAACASLDNSVAVPANLAFLTLQVGPVGSAFGDGLADLQSILKDSPMLRNASQIQFSSVDRVQALIVAYFSPGSSSEARARAFFDLGDRSATIALTQIHEAPLSLKSAEALLLDMLRRLRSANVMVDVDGS